MQKSDIKWIVCQVGSREHYAIPRMFHKNNELLTLVTDIWIKPGSLLARILKMAGIEHSSRFHYELMNAKVIHFSIMFIFIDLIRKIPFLGQKINRDKIVSLVFAFCLYFLPKKNIVIFSYNYVAYHIFKRAKNYKIRCILGQIDAGPKAGEINRKLFKETFSNRVLSNPDLYLSYGKKWQNECEWAHCIVVNSEWSKQMLTAVGIDSQKITIIPIAYSPPPESIFFTRDYPSQFSEERPLKVLFIGTLKLLKGIYPLLQAIKTLKDYPIKFYLVGGIQIPDFLLSDLPNNCIIINRVKKEDTAFYYKTCDIMILPTYSDGFAITQLEAQAWKLPILASRHCAKIVENNVNGLTLNKIDFEEIKEKLLEVFESPQKLKYFSSHAIDMNSFSLDTIYHQYHKLLY